MPLSKQKEWWKTLCRSRKIDVARARFTACSRAKKIGNASFDLVPAHTKRQKNSQIVRVDLVPARAHACEKNQQHAFDLMPAVSAAFWNLTPQGDLRAVAQRVLMRDTRGRDRRIAAQIRARFDIVDIECSRAARARALRGERKTRRQVRGAWRIENPRA